jgi:hypothetical protein
MEFTFAMPQHQNVFASNNGCASAKLPALSFIPYPAAIALYKDRKKARWVI